MTTEQARKEIVEETLSDRDELRRALIDAINVGIFETNPKGDLFLDQNICLIELKPVIFKVLNLMNEDTIPVAHIKRILTRVVALIGYVEDIAISYANSVNISEE